MKKLVTILTAMALMTALGCEDKPSEPARPTQFDPNLDGPASMLDEPISDDIAKDQKEIAKKVAQAGAAVEEASPAAPTPAPVTGTPVEQARQIVGSMISAVRPGREERFLDFLDKANADTLRPIYRSARDLPAKADQLDKLMKDKLGVNMPDDAKQGFTLISESLPGLPQAFLKAKPADLKFAEDGQDVVVTAPGGQILRLTNVAGAWKVQLPADDLKDLSVFTDVHKGLDTFLAEMSKGINDGSITRQNFSAKGEELSQKHVEPAMGKFFELMTKGLKVPAPTGPEPDTSL